MTSEERSIGLLWSCRNYGGVVGKVEFADVVRAEIRRILLHSLFTMTCFAFVWIARMQLSGSMRWLSKMSLEDSKEENDAHFIASKTAQEPNYTK